MRIALSVEIVRSETVAARVGMLAPLLVPLMRVLVPEPAAERDPDPEWERIIREERARAVDRERLCNCSGGETGERHARNCPARHAQ